MFVHSKGKKLIFGVCFFIIWSAYFSSRWKYLESSEQKLTQNKRSKNTPFDTNSITKSEQLTPSFTSSALPRSRKENSVRKNCQAVCDEYPSKIILQNQLKAGLKDRKSIFAHVANLAGFLCAKVILPKPCEMLTKLHNNNQEISCQLQWSDFFKLSFVNKENVFSAPLLSYIEKSVINELNGSFVQQYTLAKSLSLRKIQFVWVISQSYYSWRNNLQQHLHRQLPANNNIPNVFNIGCDYTSGFRYSTRILNMKTNFVNKYKIIDQQFITLHIRRGDAIRECDSSIGALQSYIDCSLQKCNLTDQRPILLFTDEKNLKYLSSVKKLFSGKNRRMIHVDNIIGNEVQNNYFVFEVGEAIKSSTRYRLSRRRSWNCHSCDSIC